ncbi:hypothetical protein [uncultured Enterovirga sp.]|uniref:hypothetical protein n=1 Tax=uncultured Enterovirga sp. TaxID=2026352 RepID=UPI0035CBA423
MVEGRPGIGPFRLAGAVAWFEMRLQLRSPVFLIVVAIAGLMVVGSLTVERLQVGPLRPGSKTGVEAVLFVHLVWSQFFLFTAAAFGAQAALRDEETDFGPIVAATAAPRPALAAGRLGGALAVVLLSFLSVPAAVVLAPFAPIADPLAAPDAHAVAFGLFVLAIPNLVLATATFLSVATILRSAMAAYLGAVALLALYGLGSGKTGDPGWLVAILDPFGSAAIQHATVGWTETQRATALPSVDGALALNRLLWFGVACAAALFGTLWRPKPCPVGPKPHENGRPAPAPRPPAVERRFGLRTTVGQFLARTRLEFGLVRRSPFLAVLLLLGVANVAGAMAQLPPDATRADALARVDEAFRLVPIVVGLFWAGELVWGERDLGVAGLVGACPVPNWALLLPKVLTLLLVLSASLGSAALAAAVLEAWWTGLVAPSAWLLGFALPRAWDAGLLAILAVFLQAAAPGKLAGFGLMVLYLISALALETMGFHGDLYRYGGGSGSLGLDQAGSPHAFAVRAYWGAAAVLLLLGSQLMVGRGSETGLRTRLRRAYRDVVPAQVVLGLAAAGIMVLLAHILAG